MLKHKVGARLSAVTVNKFHQIKIFNVKITKNGSCLGTVRFAFIRKISVKTVKLENLNSGRVHDFRQKSWKTVKKVRYAVRSNKTVPRGKR
jgi:hypothetical protein